MIGERQKGRMDIQYGGMQKTERNPDQNRKEQELIKSMSEDNHIKT